MNTTVSLRHAAREWSRHIGERTAEDDPRCVEVARVGRNGLLECLEVGGRHAVQVPDVDVGVIVITKGPGDGRHPGLRGGCTHKSLSYPRTPPSDSRTFRGRFGTFFFFQSW